MNLVETLLKEHSKKQRDKVFSYIGKDPKRFAQLVGVFLTGPYRITQRASWPLSTCIEKHPALIGPHLKKILLNLQKPDLHDAVKRNTIRLLQYITIPKNLQGITCNICFEWLANPKEPVAIRAFCITVLTKLAIEEPDLKSELIAVIEQQMPYAQPAFLSRARKALKALKSN